MQIVHTENAANPLGHYSQAVIHNGLVYVSGQLPIINGKVIYGNGNLTNVSGRHSVEIDLSKEDDGVYIAVLSVGNKGYLLKQDVKRIIKE